ncbi:MAG: ABC transporter permease [Candidatus Eisenbacteria bacterium]|uniref:ABC transporter permease n=1 Tax=Eiseniibacteriota bacterium TaxID=2212470 RepID=A0A948RYF7_UNCEI|nr:ABC transporter permease [Candidatus Eisenbacteria bacterium]MBU1947382.1 ABC transporter permease [Candidatus Eisenbacteria bacterium]MBU2693150.1 ABC transporter permease [Candidatus Eisenbacteria bacterium]
MMRQIWIILLREYLSRVRKRLFLIGTILGPVLMSGFMIIPLLLAGSEIQTPLRITVVDPSRVLYPMLYEALNDTLNDGGRRFELDRAINRDASVDSLSPYLTYALEEDLTDICLVLPLNLYDGGYGKIYSRKVGDFDIISRLSNEITEVIVHSRLEEHGFDSQEIGELTRPIELKTYKIEKGGAREGGFMQDFMGSWIFVMILYSTILLYGNTIQRSIIEEKGSRIIEVMLSTTTAYRMMWGKILGVGLVGMTQYAIWGIFGVIISTYAGGRTGVWAEMGQVPVSTFIYFILFFVLGYFLYSCLAAAIGAMVNSDHEAQQLQWPIVLLLVTPVMIGTVVAKDPSSNVATVTSLIPFFTPLLMFMRVNLYTPPAHEVVLSIILTVATIVILVSFTARIYRVGILMYGKRPTLRELARWTRQE